MGNLPNIEECPNINDLTRLAYSMRFNKQLFISVIQSYENEGNLFNSFTTLAQIDVIEERSSEHIFGMFPRVQTVKRTANDLVSLMRKAFGKKDTNSLSEVYNTLMNLPQQDVVRGLIESLSKQSPAKQTEILNKVLGGAQKWKNNVEVQIIKRGVEHKSNKDSYEYYIVFRNIRSKESRTVKFQNHTSAAIYAMYLIDRVSRRDNCSSFDVMKNINMLQKVYFKMFPEDDEIKGLGIIKTINSKGFYESDKNRLKQFYSDINKTINDNLSDWDYVMPYRCEADSYVSLSPTSIFIINEIIPEGWKIVA